MSHIHYRMWVRMCRGFTVVRHETENVSFQHPGRHQVGRRAEEHKEASSLEVKSHAFLLPPINARCVQFACVQAVEADSQRSSSETTQAESASSDSGSSESHAEPGHVPPNKDLEGSRSVTDSSSQESVRSQSSSDSELVSSLVRAIMTKAAADSKSLAAETKEAEKLAADAAKAPTPKDDVALKKGATGEARLYITNLAFIARS